MHRTGSRLGDYLRARRAVTQPEDVGLPRDPSRRVDGLRREEVAQLAGISPEYYLRLEQGKARQPSEQVLAALAAALRLDRHADIHIRRLAAVSEALPDTVLPVDAEPAEVSLVTQMRGVGALLVDTNLDVLHCNAIAAALIPEVAEHPRNLIAQLLRSSARTLGTRGELIEHLVAVLRFISEPNERLQRIVGELSLSSPEFSSAWAKHDVRQPGPVAAQVQVAGLGTITLECNMLMFASGHHAVITLGGSHDLRGRASLSYLQEVGDEILCARMPSTGSTHP